MPKALGEDILQRFTPDAARLLQEAIEQAGGNEVLCAGSLDGAGRLYEIRTLARGHAGAVTAQFEQLDVRDVVIHNHPSGELTPSNADLELAAMYSAHGHGVYIVDNLATRVYVVVDPFLPRDAVRLDDRELASTLSPSGMLARQMPDFEVRPQQTRMMEAIARAFNEDGIAVIEAPTGVGKTFAYLLPAVLWAVRNRERVVITTRTINLQEQIVHKDIPVVRKCIEENFTACLVKGRGNYLCLRKLERAQSEATLFDDEETQEKLQAIVEWSEHTKDGSLSDLPFVPGRELWDRVCSEADSCTMGRCPNSKQCFVGRARREVAKADIVVANHHMLFSDIAIKQEMGNFTSLAVLPAYKRVVFDEAHSIEDSATEYFGVSATKLGAQATFGRFVRMERGRERGLLPLLRARLVKDCPQLSITDFEAIQQALDGQFIPALTEARDLVRLAFDALRELTAAKCGQVGRDIKWRLTPEVLADASVRRLHEDRIVPAVEALRLAVRHGNALHRRLKAIKPAPNEEVPAIEGEVALLGAYARRLENLANTLAEGTSAELQENTVRWVEIDARRDQFVRIARCPLDVGQPLAEWVYENLQTIAMTSATLTVKKEFAYLFGRLGLDRVPRERVDAIALDSPFDFDSQAILAMVDDLPEPSDRSFVDRTVGHIGEALKISRGHAFVLFTSFYALDFTYRQLADDLRNRGITPLRQGEATRTQLLDRFRSDTSSVLFATDSFWEGVDVAGESLQCVILPKLPFRVPTEPILQARAEAIEQAGGNAFTEYSVPQAVIKFRQGFGRLIRRKSDRGVILVLDRRIVTKYYGKMFLESLPSLRRIRGGWDRVSPALEAFFHPQPDPAPAGDSEETP